MFRCCAAPPHPARAAYFLESATGAAAGVDEQHEHIEASHEEGKSERVKLFARLIAASSDFESRIEICARTDLLNDIQDAIQNSPVGSSDRIYATALLYNLAAADPNRVHLYQEEKLRKAVIAACLEEPVASKCRIYCLGFLRECAQNVGVQTEMQANQEVIDAIATCIRNGPINLESRVFAVGVIKNLATSRSIQLKLFHNHVVQDELVSALRTDDIRSTQAVSECLATFEVFFTNEEIAKLALDGSPSLLDIIVQRYLSSESRGLVCRARALAVLNSVAKHESLRVHLYLRKNIMNAIETCIKEEEISSESKSQAFALLWALALVPSNQSDMMQSRWIMTAIRERALLKEPIESPVKANAFGLLWSLAQEPKNKSQLIPQRRLIKLTAHCIAEEPPASEVRANALGFLAELASIEDSMLLTQFLRDANVLLEAVDKSLRAEPFAGSEGKVSALSLLLNLSRWHHFHEHLLNCESLMNSIALCCNNDADAAGNALVWNVLLNTAAGSEEIKLRLLHVDWLQHQLEKILRCTDPNLIKSTANALWMLQNLSAGKSSAALLWSRSRVTSALRSVLETILDKIATEVLLTNDEEELTKATATDSPKLPSSTNLKELEHEKHDTASESSHIRPPNRQRLSNDIRPSEPAIRESSSSASASLNVEMLLCALGVLQNLGYADDPTKTEVLGCKWIMRILHDVLKTSALDKPVHSFPQAEASTICLTCLWNLVSGSQQNVATLLATQPWVLLDTVAILEAKCTQSTWEGANGAALLLLRELVSCVHIQNDPAIIRILRSVAVCFDSNVVYLKEGCLEILEKVLDSSSQSAEVEVCLNILEEHANTIVDMASNSQAASCLINRIMTQYDDDFELKRQIRSLKQLINDGGK